MKSVNLFLTIAVIVTAISNAIGAVVTVDVEKTHQKISGFGTCSAWCGTLTEQEGEQLFSTTNGAGLSLHRIQSLRLVWHSTERILAISSSRASLRTR